MGSLELTARLAAQYRRNQRAGVEACFREAGVPSSFLSDERQLELLSVFRSWSEIHRGAVVDIPTALTSAAERAVSELLVVMGDEPDRQPAVLVPKTAFFTALYKDPFFADRDGLLLFAPEGNGGLFIDYHDTVLDADTEVTLYGAWCQRGSK